MQKPSSSGNGVIPPLNPTPMGMWTWLQISDMLDVGDGGSMQQHRRVEEELRFGHLGDSCLPSNAKINGMVVR